MQRTIIRRKALDTMMKQPPAHVIPRRGELPTTSSELAGKATEEGYVSMMVTPEEKQMILDQRAKEEGAETPAQEAVEVEQVKD